MMSITINESGHLLITTGLILFLIGLFQGLSIPKVRNPRMALSAHLGALQSAMALMIFGIVWDLVTLTETLETIALYFTVSGFYLIWLGITIASITGASKALPMAGEGYSATSLVENFVTMIEVIGVLMSLLSVTLIVIGII